MRRLRWFDIAALILLLLWVMDSQIAQVDFATASLKGWDWWRPASGHILPALTAFILYSGLVYWAAQNRLPVDRRK